MVVQIDTASSVVNDIAAVRKAMDGAKHPALLMVDTVASLGTMPFEMDGWGVDVAMCGSQKGMMTPPGLASSPPATAQACTRRRGSGPCTGTGRSGEGEEHYMKYCGTPPEHLLFGLRKALDLLFAEGMENAFRRHALLAEAVRRAVDRWTRRPGPGVQHHRSDQARQLGDQRAGAGPRPAEILDYAREKCGVVLGVGIGDLRARLPHRPHGPRQRADGDWYAGRHRDGAEGARDPARSGGVQAAIDYLAEKVEA